MSLSDKQWEFLKDVSLLIHYCDRRDIKVTAGELWRTDAQQELYLDEGKTTVAHSKHQDRLAIDLNFFIRGHYTTDRVDLQEIGDFWESLHPKNAWGGNWTSFVDTPHFERRP